MLHCNVLLCLQLFKMLGLKTSGEGSVSRETITLAHFLDVADKVVSGVPAAFGLLCCLEGKSPCNVVYTHCSASVQGITASGLHTVTSSHVFTRELTSGACAC